MDNFLNFRLLTPLNIIAIGAIILFWGCVTFSLKSTVQPSQ